MESPQLTIRNLTSTPIKLKLVERFGAPKGFENGTALSNIIRSLSSLMRSSATTPSSPKSPPTISQLTANAQSFASQDISIHIDAFATSKTDAQVTEKSANEVLRLTFESDGERYRLDTPSPTYGSTTLTPLTPNPKYQYTAIYLPHASHLTLFSSANLNSWMNELKDETPLSALSIPGTHNSPTCHRALPSVRCQAVTPRKQLENGIRFFDIRLQIEKPDDLTKDGLILVHSVFPISLTGTKYFRNLVHEIFQFLDQNPSETIIMSLKREGTGNGTDAQLSRILRNHYAGDVSRWFTAPRIPTLGEARRKIVLIRRFGLEDGLRKTEWDGKGWCIDAETWEDNTPHDTCPSGDVCVQDFYEVLEAENIERKMKVSKEHLERAAAAQSVCPLPGIDLHSTTTTPTTPLSPFKQPFYINFLSASNFWKVGCWPEKIAAKLNPEIVDFLCRNHHDCSPPTDDNNNSNINNSNNNNNNYNDNNNDEEAKKLGDGSTGIVVCDWVGNNGNWDLVRCIVGMNAKLKLKLELELEGREKREE